LVLDALMSPGSETPARNAATLADRHARIETPERVAFAHELADLGSRFTALLIDLAILFALILMGVVGLTFLARILGATLHLLAGWGLAMSILLAFSILWGYFVYFEGLRGGQTPGKRRLGIRVVHDGGYPLSLRGAAVRNLLRVVDIQPIPSCLVGGVAMLIHPQTKRLGDMAAGTLVVRERAATLLPEERDADGPEVAPPRLEPAEVTALNRYISRRQELTPDVRRRIAASLAARVEHRAPERRKAEDDDAFLQALHARVHTRRSAEDARARALTRRQGEPWARYQRLLDEAQAHGLAGLPEAEVSRFAALYREVSSDLARARTYRGSTELIHTLEALVAAGHSLLYQPPRRSWREFALWITGGFPALVRLRWKPIALAAAFLFAPALLAYGVVRFDPSIARELLPAEVLVRAEQGAQRQLEGRGYVEVPEVFMPVMATGIIANNVQVTFIAFAGGLFAGAGTLLVLALNGVLLGAVAALFANHGLSLYLWSFVLPHGGIELTAIAIAGGAGLWLGSALLLPGRRLRREVMVVRGREAVTLIAGTAVMLVVAGLIEGFISPSPLPAGLKLLLAGIVALVLVAYILAAGRDPASRERAVHMGRL
jgi:uncharacterized membrane protein SpoIIM required for sporulation/uncharacterized RDD family membrane protein YckC